jgi:hypothetical protein
VAAAIGLPGRGERGSGIQPGSEDQKIIWEKALNTRLIQRAQLLKAAGSRVSLTPSSQQTSETAEHPAPSSKLQAELMHSMQQMNMAGAKTTQMLR